MWKRSGYCQHIYFMKYVKRKKKFLRIRSFDVILENEIFHSHFLFINNKFKFFAWTVTWNIYILLPSIANGILVYSFVLGCTNSITIVPFFGNKFEVFSLEMWPQIYELLRSAFASGIQILGSIVIGFVIFLNFYFTRSSAEPGNSQTYP